jgi:hypothetical protein
VSTVSKHNHERLLHLLCKAQRNQQDAKEAQFVSIDGTDSERIMESVMQRNVAGDTHSWLCHRHTNGLALVASAEGLPALLMKVI